MAIFGNNQNNTLNGDNLANAIFGFDGDDFLNGFDGDDYLDGGAENDDLNGGIGNDVLDGGSGNDTLSGGGDNDILNGGTGDDDMQGGLGDDVYIVDSAGDVVVEAAGAGTDLVISSVSYVLPTNVENLILVGGISGAVNATGNNQNNILQGNARGNTLDGLRGNDTLTGGGGLDRFRFNSGAAFNLGTDTITDFVTGTDKIRLDKTTFSALTSAVSNNGFSVAGEFAVVGSNAAAASSSAFIVYNQANGTLFYNQNGAAAGLGTGGRFAILTGTPTLSGSDFELQA